MPFKGDSRLGGRRRNDSTLNGMTEGPSYPAAGTILSTLSNVGYPEAFGGLTVDVSSDPITPDFRESQACDVYVRADGTGGQYTDYSTAFNIGFYADGTVIYSIDGYYVPSYVYVYELDQSYPNGGSVADKVHDGNGGWRTQEYPSYYGESTIAEQQDQTVYGSYNGESYPVGTGTMQFRHNGNGGYYSVMTNVIYNSSGSTVGTYSGAYTIQLPDNNYYSVGTTISDVQSDGTGGLYSIGGSTTYNSYGTFIANFGGNNYYCDGSGSYYSEGDGSGSGSGNTSPTYINIGGTDYQNGTYDSSTGSTYYASYGEYITYYDGYSYYHDGNGSYYTS